MDKYNFPLYMTKTELIYRTKAGENVMELWETLLSFRREKGIQTFLLDQNNKNFFLTLTEEIKNKVIIVDDLARNNFYEGLEEKDKIDLIKAAQEDEAFYSSVIEGAHTTKKRTKELVEKKLEPQTKDEKMVLNNYNALMFILENLHKNIDEEVITKIYEIVTQGTLDENEEGYRTGQNFVKSMEEIIYVPPKYEDVPLMMKDLIKFINEDKDENLHPFVKAVIMHFYFVYIHPFNDGNGRTARAITYMYLLKSGYHFFKFFSISSLLKEFRTTYYKAIKNAEDFDSDLTYFVIFYLDMMEKSIKKVTNDFRNQYLLKITKNKIFDRGMELNDRQEKTLEKIIKVNKKNIDITFYSSLNKVVQETSRKDLQELVEMEILTVTKLGKKNVYNLSEKF